MNNMRVSKEKCSLQVTKWIKIPFLIDAAEMREFFSNIPFFQLYQVHKPVGYRGGIVSQEVFLELYAEYISLLKAGVAPPLEQFRELFSSIWSLTEEALYLFELDQQRFLIKPCAPIVQAQMHYVLYDPLQRTFRSQLFGTKSISWGIQLGFPHLCVDPHTFEIQRTSSFANAVLFKSIQEWMRRHTVPTPFIVEGNRMNVPIRLGKKCSSWICSHPQLFAEGIKIAEIR